MSAFAGLPREEALIEAVRALAEADVHVTGLAVTHETFARILRSIGPVMRGPLGSVQLTAATGPVNVFPPNFPALASRDGVATQLRRIADMLDGGQP